MKIPKNDHSEQPLSKEWHSEQVEQRLKEIKKHSPSMLKTFEKAFSGKSKATALKAKCLDCCCYQRNEVEKCTTESCPLWQYRPYQP